MKLSQYANKVGVTYKTASRWYRAGTLDAYQTATGIIIVREKADEKPVTGRIALKHAHKRLRRLEWQKSKREKGGKNRKKTCCKLAKQHARIANIRKDAAHKLTSYLSKNHALVAIEDLHVAGMLKNHKMAQAVSDSNFGEIRRQLEYKASWQSVHLVLIDRWYASSKTCSGCGWVDEDQDLSDRTFICQECGLVMDRDLNAAINILKEALRTTGSFSESYAYGESSSGLVSGSGETALVEIGTNLHLGMS